ncbi:DUF4194 domain-containing protein [Candidatus Thiosymbion oneisti]|uniref:DUF4194 domain-containing protein n=1 Tax=Candidatus Thiosymbion oneisti TaxID=589554 RepID=UPI000AD4111F|nr:DUF4194 domain-containing protein [Candidatus Thiosymbion oneisti]
MVESIHTRDAADSPSEHPAVERAVKDCVQELLRTGVLEATRKPNLYRTALTARDTINGLLEALDLCMQIDEVRGLAFIRVVDGYDGGDRDQWSHPLLRRQRLNLEQSLLVAILRRFYVAHEVDKGVGDDAAVVHLDQLLPELNHFLGETGSDRQDDKRLRLLLEQLRGHGLVSEIDDDERLRIRPLIVHVANPANLQNLLAALARQAGADRGQDP